MPIAESLGRSMTYQEGIPHISDMTFQSRRLARSHDKLKTLYPHYHNPYGYKTWQDDDLYWVTSTHKVKWLYSNVVLRDKLTN